VNPDGCLRAFTGWQEQDVVYGCPLDEPDVWIDQSQTDLVDVLRRVRERLHERNERLPVLHFLYPVAEDGNRLSGSTELTVPSGGIELVFPHPPMVRLDGGHCDPLHRNEIKKYRRTIDPAKLEAFRDQIEKLRSGRRGNSAIYTFGPLDLTIEETDGWLPAQTVLNVLGERIEVESKDAIARFENDLATAIEFGEQAKRDGKALYWLSG